MNFAKRGFIIGGLIGVFSGWSVSGVIAGFVMGIIEGTLVGILFHILDLVEVKKLGGENGNNKIWNLDVF